MSGLTVAVEGRADDVDSLGKTHAQAGNNGPEGTVESVNVA